MGQSQVTLQLSVGERKVRCGIHNRNGILMILNRVFNVEIR